MFPLVFGELVLIFIYLYLFKKFLGQDWTQQGPVTFGYLPLVSFLLLCLCLLEYNRSICTSKHILQTIMFFLNCNSYITMRKYFKLFFYLVF